MKVTEKILREIKKEKKVNGWSIASQILGILCMLTLPTFVGPFLFGGLGIIFAELSKCGDTVPAPAAKRGRIFSWAGIIVCTAFIVLLLLNWDAFMAELGIGEGGVPLP